MLGVGPPGPSPSGTRRQGFVPRSSPARATLGKYPCRGLDQRRATEHLSARSSPAAAPRRRAARQTGRRRACRGTPAARSPAHPLPCPLPSRGRGWFRPVALHLAEIGAADLAADGLGQVGDELDLARIL